MLSRRLNRPSEARAHRRLERLSERLIVCKLTT
nr:MAG TPA: hypothetical protein [Caudoviricetes sp.]